MNVSAIKKEFLIREKNIPQQLKDFPHWLVWRYEKPVTDKPNAKPRKMPYYADGGKRGGVLGSADDISGLCSFRTAIQAARQRGFDGVGLAILPEQDITVIDLDDCISDTGVYSDFANELIEHGSYVERSPSGRGLRAVYQGALVHDAKRNFHIANGERVEVYCGKAYTTFTGNKLPSIELDNITPLPRAIKRKLVKGMGDRVASEASGDGSEGSSDALVSMNAIALPAMTVAQAARVLKGLPARWGASGEGTWYQVAAALHMQFGGSEEAYAALDAWSSERDGYDEPSNRARWKAGFGHAHGKQTVTSMKNLVFEARDAGTKFKQATLESWGLAKPSKKKTEDIELPDDEVDEEVAAAWQPVDMQGWAASKARPAGTPMLIQHWLTDENATLFSSTGGSGKSYIALTLLAFAAAGGQKWFGVPMAEGRALFVSAEDPKKDIWARLWGICEKYGLDKQDVARNMDIVDVSELLHRAIYEAGDFGKADFTKQYALLESLLERGGYKYAVLDNVSEFFAGNENSRNQVVSFVGSIKRLAAQHKLAILLLGHTAKVSDSSYSGSTAWHNSTRVRWSLEEDKDDGSRKLVVERITHGERGRAGKWVWDTEYSVLAMGEQCGAGSASAEFAAVSLEEALYDAVMEITERGERVPVSIAGPQGPIAQNPGVLDALHHAGFKPKEYPLQIRTGLATLKEKGRLVEVPYKGTNRKSRMGYEIDIIG